MSRSTVINNVADLGNQASILYWLHGHTCSLVFCLGIHKYIMGITELNEFHTTVNKLGCSSQHIFVIENNNSTKVWATLF